MNGPRIWALPRNPEALEGKAVSMDRNLPKLWGVGSIPTAPTINPDDSVALALLNLARSKTVRVSESRKSYPEIIGEYC